MNRPVIIVHGGAWYIPPEKREAYVGGCRRAAKAGWARLTSGASALDAVEAAVRILEDDPTYDAGRGSHFNRLNRVQTDAIIMDGETLDFGAVAAVERIRNPISLAREVMVRSEHSFIVGPGAEAFAELVGLALCDPDEMMGTYDTGGWAPPTAEIGLRPGDTVGAVALDRAGHLAVATSTGGTPDKWPGRVGDSPLVGCGAYADDAAGAAAATGSGEALMRIVTSKAAVDLIAGGLAAQAAAEAVIARLWDRVRGYGGVILIDRAGRVGLAHNTPNLSYAYVTPEAGLKAGVEIAGPGTPGWVPLGRPHA
ncbi:MAG: isoaspartyl peptidase/L-asparaginase family protein [Anaerolineae bacterium]